MHFFTYLIVVVVKLFAIVYSFKPSEYRMPYSVIALTENLF